MDRLLNNSKGFSLIEILLAVLFVGGIAVTISQFSSSFNSGPASLRRVCETYSSSIVSLVSEETPYRNILNFQSQPGTRNSATPFTDSKALLGTQYQNPDGSAPDAYDINKGYIEDPDVTADEGVQLQSFQLIQGSIRTLAELYNGQGIGCNFVPYNRLSNQIPVPSNFLKLPNQGNVRITYRIEPYRISDGLNLCNGGGGVPIPARVFPMPRGPESTGTPLLSDAYSVGSGVPTGILGNPATYLGAYNANDETLSFLVGDVANPGSSMATVFETPTYRVGDRDMGLKLSVQTTYAQPDKDGVVRDYSCISSQDFSYPPDNHAPPVPDIARSILADNSSINPANATALWNHCGATRPLADGQGTATLEMGYGAGVTMEPGVQLLCKDLSFVRVPVANPTKQRACYLNSSGATIQHPYTDQPAWLLNSATDGTNRQYEFTKDVSLRDKAWVPCDQMRQCGRNPTGPTLLAGGHAWRLPYTGLPFGCHLDFEVAGVDTAGNRSSATAPRFLDKVASGSSASGAGIIPGYIARATEVHQPFCGTGTGNHTFDVRGLGYYCAPKADWAIPVGGVAPSGWNAYLGGNGYYTCATTCCWNSPGSNSCRPWTM